MVNSPTRPSSCAVLGDEADAGVEDLAHRAADELAAVERDRAGDVGPAGPSERLGELGLAVALHAGDGEDLAGARRRS